MDEAKNIFLLIKKNEMAQGRGGPRQGTFPYNIIHLGSITTTNKMRECVSNSFEWMNESDLKYSELEPPLKRS